MLVRYTSILCALLFLTSVPLLHAQPLPHVEPEEAGFAMERLERLPALLHEYAEDDRLPGGVVLVARHGNIALLEAFGERDMETGSRMRENDIFRIASQTKALVSVSVMMLQEEGHLLLSDPVGKYLPEYMETTVAVPNDEGRYNIEKAERPITIHDLLTHTAGIGYGTGVAQDRWEEAGITGWYFADRNEPIRTTVARIADLPFDAHPGERWVYGYATDILGALIEEVSSQSLDAFLLSNILEPLGMHDTHFYLPESESHRLSVVYSVNEDGNLERAPEAGGRVSQGAYVEGPRTSYSGGAGLLSTVSDYARFLQMLLNGGEFDGARILSRKSVELMTVDHLDGIAFRDGEGFGLGFYIVEDVGARGVPGSTDEYGWGGAYHTTYWVDSEEGLIVVYFTQVIPRGDLDDFGKLRALVYQALME